MPWYDWIAAFFAGAFLANAVPHFVHGASGDRFPTPFAKPPGRGLSSAPVNVVWALFNFLVGALLAHAGRVVRGGWVPLLVACAGAAAVSIQLSLVFQKRQRP